MKYTALKVSYVMTPVLKNMPGGHSLWENSADLSWAKP